MKALFALILAIIFLSSVLLDQAYRALPLKELRRRARSGKDQGATAVYKMAAFGRSLQILLWLLGSAAITLLFLLAVGSSTWAAVALVLVASWLVVASQPLRNFEGAPWRLAAKLAPLYTSLLFHLHPIFSKLPLKRLNTKHSGLYEKEDLLELLQNQPAQAGNRLSESEVNLAAGALSFTGKTAESVMVPASKIKFVETGDSVGPHLMDELHASGNKYFPVVKNLKNEKPEIVGMMYLADIIDHDSAGKVASVMHKRVNYINEAQNLQEALHGFVKAQTHVFIVTNKFEEIVGMLGLEDVLEQVLGQPAEGFDQHDNLLAVASIEDNYQAPQQSEPIEPEEPKRD